MKLIITATNREGSLTFQVAKIIEDIYKKLNEPVEILDLKKISFSKIVDKPYQEKSLSSLKPYLNKVAQAEAIIIVCPEYNGGMPGLIKHFIDHWYHPESFVYKPICLVGLGGKFGALRPIEQLQAVLLYRHSFVFPIRVFIQNIQNILKRGRITDKNIMTLLNQQARHFTEFTKVLKSAKFS